MDTLLLDAEAMEKISSVQGLILEYLQEKNYPEERIIAILGEEIKTGLPAYQKLLLQQMIRERAQKEGQDLDALIAEEKEKTKGIVGSKGQILGVLSKVEGDYVDRLLQEQLDKKVIVKH